MFVVKLDFMEQHILMGYELEHIGCYRRLVGEQHMVVVVGIVELHIMDRIVGIVERIRLFEVKRLGSKAVT